MVNSAVSKAPDLLLDRLKENVSLFQDKTAVTFLVNGENGGKVETQRTYNELAIETDTLARRLLDLGVKKGERVVLVYPPSLDFMIAFIACLKAGVVAVPTFPPNPTRRDTVIMFSRIAEGCGAKIALTSASYQHMKKLANLKDAFSRLKQNYGSHWPELQWVVTNNNSSNQTKKTKAILDHTPADSDIAFLQYTSGSTSEPKGVMITHGNLAHNLHIITDELKAVDDTVVVSWLPQYHDMGLIGSYLGLLYCGGTGYYMSPLSFVQRPMMWIEAISKYHGTHLQAPNFAFKLTARKFNSSNYTPSTLTLSSVRHIINAAEPVDEDSINSFQKAFVPYGLRDDVMFPTYGLAEHTVFVCSGGTQRLTVSKKALEVDGKVVLKTSDSSSSDITRLVGCGYPERQSVDVKIVETESLSEVAEDIVGEIWIHSQSKAAGYFGKSDETKEDFHAQLNGNEHGYLRTGDLGFLHNKELFICGRLKDLIIVGGRNYYPQDIEATAETSNHVRPGCSAAFTIDQTHEGGEEVALVMELREIPKPKDVNEVCAPIADNIRSIVNQEHSLGLTKVAFLRPRTVPKTSSGKIARSWCRKGLNANTLDIIYQKSFKESVSSFEIEQTTTASNQSNGGGNSKSAEEIRSMSKKAILSKLVTEVAMIGSIPPASIDKKAALITILDSLSISQFKGLLEAEYATKLSDEYLFQDTTTLVKLADIVKLGYAPDDVGGNDENGQHAVSGNMPANTTNTTCAEKMGCPPGVMCVIS